MTTESGTAGAPGASEFLQVFTTAGSRDDAGRIARGVVERRLAGCAQVLGPIFSAYWWDGKVEEAGEWLCLMKTSRALYPDLELAVRELHAYDVPEIVAVPVLAGSEGYLAWLGSVLKADA